jgi:hypothetical protein
MPKYPEHVVINFVIVTLPKSPGSSTLISLPRGVFDIAPAKVLRGAIRLHGLASLHPAKTSTIATTEQHMTV